MKQTMLLAVVAMFSTPVSAEPGTQEAISDTRDALAEYRKLAEDSEESAEITRIVAEYTATMREVEDLREKVKVLEAALEECRNDDTIR